MSDHVPSPLPDAIPESLLEAPKSRRTTWLWLLTVACLVLSGILFANVYRNQGERIEIEFDHGYGLQPSDALKFRGIEIGRIEKIDLRTGNPGIVVSVRVAPNAKQAITEGTTFWIARPIVSIDSVRGLETVIGPKYIAMEPGGTTPSTSRHFIGLESPPPIQPPSGSIEIILDAEKRFGLASGAPILHRGFRIGYVLSVDLASDARSVILRAAIDPEYRELVRSNSKFWVRSGWRFDIGLSGIRIDADSVSEILSGGIEFATPDSKGAVAVTGSRFVLHEEAESEWLEWQPSIPYGALWERFRKQTPLANRVTLHWKEKSFGFTVERRRSGWGVLLDDGSLLCHDDLATPPASALDQSATLEVLGDSQPLDGEHRKLKLSDGSHMAQVRLRISIPPTIPRFSSQIGSPRPGPTSPASSNPVAPSNAITPSNPVPSSEILMVGPAASHAILLDPGRLTLREHVWEIDPNTQVAADADGSPVIEVPTGRWIGCVRMEKGLPVIALLSEDP